MVRIDLFHPKELSVYGTATAMDILHVCFGGAFVLCGCRSGFFCRCLCLDLAGRMRPGQESLNQCRFCS